jgi:alpha-ketoglutarate-dependent taurine dioxygenase
MSTMSSHAETTVTAPTMLDSIVEDDRAWTRDVLQPGDGVVPLGDDCLAELEKAVETLRAHPLPLLALRPEYFDLPACAALLERIRPVLERGRGFAILDRLPLDRYSDDEAKALYWLLGSLLTRPVAQKWDGTMIYDVRDSGQEPGNGVRPDITNVEQNFHTDNSYNLAPPDYVGLLCLRTAKQGGVSGIISFYTAHNEMLRRYPDLLPRLYRPYYFDRQREHAPDDVMVTHHPLFEYDGRDLLARLSWFQVVNGQKLAGVPLDDEGASALDAFEKVLNDPALFKEFHFEPGQIQIVNNRACGHKRTAFQDWPEPERKRHLVRLWLRGSGARSYNG